MAMRGLPRKACLAYLSINAYKGEQEEGACLVLT